MCIKRVLTLQLYCQYNSIQTCPLYWLYSFKTSLHSSYINTFIFSDFEYVETSELYLLATETLQFFPVLERKPYPIAIYKNATMSVPCMGYVQASIVASYICCEDDSGPLWRQVFHCATQCSVWSIWDTKKFHYVIKRWQTILNGSSTEHLVTGGAAESIFTLNIPQNSLLAKH